MRAAIGELRTSIVNTVSDSNEQGKHGEKHALLRPMELFCGCFWPILLYIYIFKLNLMKIRHTQPTLTFVISTLLPALIVAFYTRKFYINLRNDGPLRRWKVVMNIVMWFVILFTALEADRAYWRFARSFYDFGDMASYVNLDPNMDRGQTYMDAGQVYFKEGTQVEISKAIAFQEDEIYCVAPIVQQTLDSGGDKSGQSLSGNSLKMPKSGTVDFWAVGINCCDPSGLNFRCGESKNPLARAGIRELRDDVRPFFLMAVQEWTAWLKMPAKHPLFFHWVQDPLVRVETFYWEALKMFYFDGLRCFFGVLGGTVALHFLLFNLGL